MNKWTALALAILGAIGGYAAAEEYEIGGPLAGVPLPLFPTREGEAPGYPGVIPGATVKIGDKDVPIASEGLAPQRQLHPDSVEHWRSNDFKYLPVRSLFDRQSLVKNWKVAQMPGVDKARVENYAQPLYWGRRHEVPVWTGRNDPPRPVVRLRPADPVLELDCGMLEPGMYLVSVIGAVEMKELQRQRKPLVLSLSVNDGLEGQTSRYRLRCGYVDQFYSVAEFYFHAPVRRAYKLGLQSEQASLVPLLLHNVELHDVLAGRTMRAIKTRVTWNNPAARAPQAADDLPTPERLERDAELWRSGIPINAQPGLVYGGGKDDGINNRPVLGADGKSPEEITEQYGQWEAGKGAVLTVNRKLNLTYTLDDYRAGKPLPQPYPYADNGTGLWYAAADAAGKPQNWIPVATAIKDKSSRDDHEFFGLLNAYWSQGSLKAGRDAAVILARLAYHAPARGMQQSMSSILVQPGAYGKDVRHRNRMLLRGVWMDSYSYFDAYDKLFPLLSTDPQLAQSLGRFIPWIKTPADVVKLMDVYLVQEKAKRYMRYQEMDANNPAFLATIAAMLGDPAVTDPWMEWVFTRTWIYPLSVSGLADVLITGNDPDGAKYIGSLYYAHVETASISGEMIEKAIDAGVIASGSRYDLRDARRYPQTVAACDWFLDVRLAGLWYPRVGDVCGPVATHGFWCTAASGGGDLEKGMRRGWRWTGDPRFAWMLKHIYGRGNLGDSQWAKVESAAAQVKRAPWTANRSRVLINWFGALEDGAEHDDFRFRTCAYLRIGQGYGHAHADTLDLGVYAHGLPMTTEGGQRPGYGAPADGNSKVHNLVQVNDRSWQGHSWVSAMSDTQDARYLAAQSVPPGGFADVSLRQRQIALLNVSQGQGSRPLTPAEMHPDYRKLDPNVVTPNNYVLDINRVEGGSIHTYCFNGNSEDELVVNLDQRLPLTQLTESEQRYLANYPDPQKCFGGDAAGTVVATWRLNRDAAMSARGPEQHHARSAWSDAIPRKYTRLHLLEQQGGRVLGGYYLNKAGGNGFTVMHVRHAGESATSRVFAAVIEPYVGQPFIDRVRTMPVAGNDADARRAVAVEVQTTNGHTDWLFADGRPEKVRQVNLPDSAAKFSGEFGYLSRDQAGWRLASLAGGSLLETGGLLLKTASAQRTGKVTAVSYPDKQIILDTPWPDGTLLNDRILEIGTGNHQTTATVTRAEKHASGSALTLKRGGDFYLGRVQQVEADKGLVYCNLGMAFQGGGVIPGLNQHWVASNEEGTKFWRAEYLGPDGDTGRYAFKLSGGSVAQEDFGRLRGFRLWWFGVGDTVRMNTFASLRRLEPNVYELHADTAITLGLKAKTVELSRDRQTWQTLAMIRTENGLCVVEIPLTALDAQGRAAIRIR